jgi:hypothetical protein
MTAYASAIRRAKTSSDSQLLRILRYSPVKQEHASTVMLLSGLRDTLRVWIDLSVHLNRSDTRSGPNAPRVLYSELERVIKRVSSYANIELIRDLALERNELALLGVPPIVASGIVYRLRFRTGRPHLSHANDIKIIAGLGPPGRTIQWPQLLRQYCSCGSSSHGKRCRDRLSERVRRLRTFLIKLELLLPSKLAHAEQYLTGNAFRLPRFPR